MPGQRSAMGSRARGSRLSRLTGITVILVLAGGGTAGYLMTVHPKPVHHTVPLPTKVVSVQTVGLVAQNAQPGSSGQLVQLLGPAAAPQFTPISPAQQQSGTGQWTADLMADNTYIFIFVPTGSCLTAVGPPGKAALMLRHCNLQASQRWRRTGAAVVSQGHDFYQYASMGSRSCLTEASRRAGPVWTASMSACSSPGPMNQLIAFWWASE
jgi:hypothetical protein